MLFPTVTFAIFAVVVLTASWTLRGRPRAWKCMLLTAGWVFYAWWDSRFVLLLVAMIAWKPPDGRATRPRATPCPHLAHDRGCRRSGRARISQVLRVLLLEPPGSPRFHWGSGRRYP